MWNLRLQLVWIWSHVRRAFESLRHSRIVFAAVVSLFVGVAVVFAEGGMIPSGGAQFWKFNPLNHTFLQPYTGVDSTVQPVVIPTAHAFIAYDEGSGFVQDQYPDAGGKSVGFFVDSTGTYVGSNTADNLQFYTAGGSGQFAITQTGDAYNAGAFFDDGGGYCFRDHTCQTTAAVSAASYVIDGGHLVSATDVQFLPVINGVYMNGEFDVFFNGDYAHKAFTVSGLGSGQISGNDSIGQLRYRFGGTSDDFIRDSLYVGTTVHADGGVDVGADGSISNLQTETAVGAATGLQVNTSVADSAGKVAYKIVNSNTLSLFNDFLWIVSDASGVRASLSGNGVLLATGGFNFNTNKGTNVLAGTASTDAVNVAQLTNSNTLAGSIQPSRYVTDFATQTYPMIVAADVPPSAGSMLRATVVYGPGSTGADQSVTWDIRDTTSNTTLCSFTDSKGCTTGTFSANKVGVMTCSSPSFAAGDTLEARISSVGAGCNPAYTSIDAKYF